jgi:tetratricopeptide (TPR) repeat protein
MNPTICFIFIFFCTSLCGVETGEENVVKDIIQEANTSYSEGENSETISQRKEAFNHALDLYTHLAENPLKYSDGKLDYNIANTYFQLEQYPWAILYYYRALALRPTDEKVKQNLAMGLKKLDISPESEGGSFLQSLFFWHNSYSLPERLQALFILGVLLLGAISAYIWRREHWMIYLILGLFVCWATLLLSVGYTRYFSPIEGVLVHSTALYKDAGEQYAKVDDQPILKGVKVRVLDVLQQGKWLKVYTTSGEIGYIPYTTIRII